MRYLSNKPIRLSALGLSGILLALSVMFPVLGGLSWFVAIPFSLVLYLSLERELSWKARLLELAVFFGAYFLTMYHWVFAMYPMEFLGISPVAAAVVVVVAWLGLPLLQVIPAVCLFLLWKPLASTPFAKKHKLCLPFLAGALWVILEWVSTLTWLGVPWSRLALGQVNMLAVIQTTSLFGSYFITFLIVSVNFLLGYAIFDRRKAVLGIPVALFAVNLAVGGVMLAGVDTEQGEPVRVAAIQGNASSQEKWDPDSFLDMLERHRELTADACEDGAQIVLWTESTIPDVLTGMPATQSFIGQSAIDGNCLLLVGAFDLDGSGKQYNATFLFDREGKIASDRYYKRRLVPFGEYIPMRAFIEAVIPPLADLNALGDDLSPGRGSNLIDTEYGRIGAIICFDSIYEELARVSVRDGAELIVLPTNDSWFLGSVALSMHNSQAILRAVENRRYVVRSANTGISSVISPTGEVVASLGAKRTGYLCEDVYTRSDLTLYTRTGNLFVLVCGVYVALTLGGYVINKKKKAVA